MTVDLDAQPDILLVRKHLVEHLGAPDEVFEVSGSPIPGSPVQALNLAYFAPAGPQSPVVFATCGASLFKMNDGRRVEAIAILRREPEALAFDAVHRLLAQFALFAEANDQTIRIGDVVHASKELAGFCKMDALLFVPPVPFVEKFHQIEITGGGRVEIVWLLPVYEAEAEYALTHGPQALMMLFAAQSLDLTDPERDEANTLMDPADAIEMAKQAGEQARQRAAAAQSTLQPSGKTKTSRRDMGRGSFEVEEVGNAVRITRRGAGAKPPRPPAPERAAEPPREPPVAAAPPRAVPDAARRKPIVPRTPDPKSEVRFDLSRGNVAAFAGKKKEVEAPPPEAPKKRGPPPPQTPEELADAKKKRVEELKAKAKAAAARVAERQTGAAKAPEAGPAPQGAPSAQSARAAAKRRGAPQQAIRNKLTNPED